MKQYAVIEPSALHFSLARPPKVLFVSHCKLIAAMAAVAIEVTSNKVTDIVEIDTRPQTLVNVCTDRDRALSRLESSLEILSHLVSRDDEGAWTTVHDADTTVPFQTEIDTLLA